MAKKHSFPSKSMVIYTILVCACVGVMFLLYKLTWNFDGYWNGHRESSYDGNLLGIPFDFIKHTWSNFPNILLYAVLPVLLLVFLTIMLFKFNSGKYVGLVLPGIHFTLALALGIGFLVFLVLMIFGKYTLERTFYLNFCTNAFFVIAPPTFCLILKNCINCGYFNMKEKVDEKYKTVWKTRHVSGGYKTVSLDIKDEHGNKVGSIETQKYEEGRSYTTAETTTTYVYICKNCGNESTISSKL